MTASDIPKFFELIKKGNLPDLRRVLKSQHSEKLVNCEGGRFGISPLFAALRYRRWGVADLLLDHGASPNFVADGMPVLIMAIRIGFYYSEQTPSLSVIDKMLDLGADPNCTWEDKSAIEIALEKYEVVWNNYKIAELLLKYGANLDVAHKGPTGGTVRELYGPFYAEQNFPKEIQRLVPAHLGFYEASPSCLSKMIGNEEYIEEQIKLRVWSGFCNPDRVDVIITDLLEDDDDESKLRLFARAQFEKKIDAEKAWPKVTDCDRLCSTFDELCTTGIVAVHNAGWDMSECIHHCLSRIDERSAGGRGYCYYSEQDIDSALEFGEMHIGFGSNDGDKAGVNVGNLVTQSLSKFELSHEWNGSSKNRIKIEIDWKMRNFQ